MLTVPPYFPQVYGTHYFNVLHLFGLRGGRDEYKLASNGPDRHDGDADAVEMDVMHVNAASRAIVIDHGRVGRYQALEQPKEGEVVPVMIREKANVGAVEEEGDQGQMSKRMSR